MPKKDVKIKYGDSYIEVNPSEIPVSILEGDSVNFVLQPKAGFASAGVGVAVVGENYEANWIHGAGEMGPKTEFEVTVPGDTNTDGQNGKNYKYRVIVEGVGTIDPRVRVVP